MHGKGIIRMNRAVDIVRSNQMCGQPCRLDSRPRRRPRQVDAVAEELPVVKAPRPSAEREAGSGRSLDRNGPNLNPIEVFLKASTI